MRVRIVASVVTAALILLGTTGCNYFAPQTTLKHYDPSDGVGATIGNLDVRNALLLADDDDNASLVVTLLNTGNKALDVQLQYQKAGGAVPAERVTQTVTVDAGETSTIGDGNSEQIILTDTGVKAGSLLPLYIQYGQEPGKQILVPVLDGSLEQYATLLPTPRPSATAAQ